jgi:hypothetical protein
MFEIPGEAQRHLDTIASGTSEHIACGRAVRVPRTRIVTKATMSHPTESNRVFPRATPSRGPEIRGRGTRKNIPPHIIIPSPFYDPGNVPNLTTLSPDTIRISRFLTTLQPPTPLLPSPSYLRHPDSSTGSPCPAIEVLGLWHPKREPGRALEV